MPGSDGLGDLIGHSRSKRHHWGQRAGLTETFQGGAENWREPCNLRTAASGHEDQHCRVRCNIVHLTKSKPVATIGTALNHRMTDEPSRKIVPLEESRLERQKTKQLVPEPVVMARSTFPPGPDLWRHIVHSGNPTRHAPEKPECEAGAIDGDHRGRTPVGDIIAGLSQPPSQKRQVGNDLQKPHQSEVLHGKQAIQPLGRHLGPADTGKSDVRHSLAQGAHQTRAQCIAALLAGDQIDQQAHVA